MGLVVVGYVVVIYAIVAYISCAVFINGQPLTRLNLTFMSGKLSYLYFRTSRK